MENRGSGTIKVNAPTTNILRVNMRNMIESYQKRLYLLVLKYNSHPVPNEI